MEIIIPWSKAYFERVTSSREKMAVIVAMDRYIEDVRIVIKDLLSTISVMNVL